MKNPTPAAIAALLIGLSAVDVIAIAVLAGLHVAIPSVLIAIALAGVTGAAGVTPTGTSTPAAAELPDEVATVIQRLGPVLDAIEGKPAAAPA